VEVGIENEAYAEILSAFYGDIVNPGGRVQQPKYKRVGFFASMASSPRYGQLPGDTGDRTLPGGESPAAATGRFRSSPRPVPGGGMQLTIERRPSRRPISRYRDHRHAQVQ
jgi:hypothetical protein